MLLGPIYDVLFECWDLNEFPELFCLERSILIACDE